MRIGKLSNTTRRRKAAAAAVCLALATAPLAGCSGQDDAGATASQSASQAAADTKPSEWKTLGDAFAARTEAMASSYDDKHYVAVFKTGEDTYARVVAEMTPEVNKKVDDIDWTKPDVEEKIEKEISVLKLVTAEDVTDQRISQEELDKLVGKTGKELVDAGWKFSSYSMYGGEETAATFDKDAFSYDFTFDVSTTEGDSTDQGASVMEAKVTQVQFASASDAAVNLEGLE